MGFTSLSKKIGGWLYNATGAAASAEQNYEYQKEAMQNRHQWQVADLRKAGLNPILSANSGAATGGMGGTGSPAADLNLNPLSYINSAIDAMNRLAQNDAIEAGIEKTKADTDVSKAQGRYLTAQEKNAIADTALKNISTAAQSMDLDFWKSNPSAYNVRMGNKAMPYVGGLTGVLSSLFPANSNSAKAFKNYRYQDSY